MDIRNIGYNVKRLRTQKGLTQTAIARALHVTPQAVSRWENGACCPDLSSLVDLAQVFGTTLDELLREDSMQPESISLQKMGTASQ